MQRLAVDVALMAAYKERLEIAVQAAQTNSNCVSQKSGKLPSRLPASVKGFIRTLPEEVMHQLHKTLPLAQAAAGFGVYANVLAEAMSSPGNDKLEKQTLTAALLSFNMNIQKMKQLDDAAKAKILENGITCQSAPEPCCSGTGIQLPGVGRGALAAAAAGRSPTATSTAAASALGSAACCAASAMLSPPVAAASGYPLGRQPGAAKMQPGIPVTAPRVRVEGAAFGMDPAAKTKGTGVLKQQQKGLQIIQQNLEQYLQHHLRGDLEQHLTAAETFFTAAYGGEGSYWRPSIEQRAALAAAGWTAREVSHVSFALLSSRWGAPAELVELLVHAFTPPGGTINHCWDCTVRDELY
jgi:hypothetical protein